MITGHTTTEPLHRSSLTHEKISRKGQFSAWNEILNVWWTLRVFSNWNMNLRVWHHHQNSSPVTLWPYILNMS